jgi:quercetin dioxygenase-like cupin family protein
MRTFLVGVAFLLAANRVGASTGPSADAEAPRAVVVLDNGRVRILKASSPLAVLDHPEAVVVPLTDSSSRKAGEAYWSRDPGASRDGSSRDLGPLVIVELKEARTPSPVQSSAEGGTKPGPPPFTGMSFIPLFENDRVRVIRGRMEVGAQEGFHTHASDIVVVHLSGGAIEDTADGKTKINRWNRGDVEFEARGSSHSARNVGQSLDAVLITLKP